MGSKPESGNDQSANSETHVGEIWKNRRSPTSRDGHSNVHRVIDDRSRQDSADDLEWTQSSQEHLTMSRNSSTQKDTSSDSYDREDFIDPHLRRRSTSFSRIRLLESSSESPLSPKERRRSLLSVTEENEDNPSPSPERSPEDEKAVTWRSLPKKGQLAILTIARLAEPLTQTSLQAYMFYQLKSFDPSLPDSTIASRAGILQATFTAAQFLTAVMWGRIADSAFMGRKNVLIVGLLGTGLSCVGFGFSRSYAAAAVFRTLGGALNSNVGVMRTMISEMVEKKCVHRSSASESAVDYLSSNGKLMLGCCRYRPRAFLVLPMCFNIGVIIGPIFGGLLADPVGNYPDIFGPGSVIGGDDGVWWMKHWPYALPNVLSGIFIIAAGIAVILGLDEVSSVEPRYSYLDKY